MRKTLVFTALVLVVGAGIAWAHSDRRIREFLNGVQEVPVISTTGSGTFQAVISRDEDEIEYTLSFKELEGDVTQSHIHIGPAQNSGGIVLWLCQTTANPAPAGTTPPRCFDVGNSARANTVTGVLRAADVRALPGNGIAANEFAEVIALIRAGKTYVNVHSSVFGGGEIRSQIEDHHDH
jgi:CHRD domain